MSIYLSQTQEDAQDLDALTLAKSYFDLKEYDRAAYFLKGCCSQKAYFLYMYSRYLVRLCKYLPFPNPVIQNCFNFACDHFENFLLCRQSGEKKKDDETVDSLGEDLSVWTI